MSLGRSFDTLTVNPFFYVIQNLWPQTAKLKIYLFHLRDFVGEY